MAQRPALQPHPGGQSWHTSHNSGFVANTAGDFHAAPNGQTIIHGSASANQQQQSLSEGDTSLQSTLPSVIDYLKEAQHTVSFLFDAQDWIDEEQEYVRRVFDTMSSSSAAQTKWINKMKHNIPNIYPRLFIYQFARVFFIVMEESECTRKLKELCDWHFKNCAGLGADQYTQDDEADRTRQKLIDFVRASNVYNEPEVVNTITALSKIDLVGVAAQRELVRENSKVILSKEHSL
ncbi:hypothetical protein FIBSPDRAFT_1038567 [Athelia psychrophila]|uniref:Uncharacterized protein n=1 Tax=Athelia psychrophila TaxID=1759441 RepID=A0A166SUF5_9AGAM|nr:hypothetical protein FIBSPDRAFT_1038567 [Fibularhizoctonia sp. CBS 109695]